MLAAGTMAAQARELTSEEALDRVVEQWNSSATTGGPRRAPLAASAFSLAKVGTNAALQNTYYIFNRTSGGYVVASADDEQPAVLALIDEGKYDEQNVPDGFKAWLAEATEYGVAVPAKAPALSAAPLLDKDMIAWGQDAPYNTQCPKFNYDGYPYSTLAGCAAIAIGQIMRYHKYPAAGTGSVSYASYVYIQSQEIKTIVERTMGSYDWQNILGNYIYSSSNDVQKAAVAKFVADVACACKMNFDPTASATTDLEVAKALKNNFYYDKSLQLVDHSFYTTDEWADLLRAEIDAKRPVYLSGANVKNTADGDAVMGHAFVCDGYNSDGQFHINWGWNGTSNGYFYLTKLNPTNQGAGGSAGGYSFMSNAIIGIQPDQGGAESEAFLSLYGDHWMTEYDSDVEGGGYKLYVTVANPTATDFDGFVAIRLMEGDKMIMHPKQMAWKLGCKAGASGTLAKGIMKDYFLQHPTARLELVYAHCPGASIVQDEAILTSKLEGIKDEEWFPIASRLGAPQSLQTFVDAKNNLSFGNKADEVFQLRLAGLTADVVPKAGTTVTFTATVTNASDYEYFAPLYLFVYDSKDNMIGYSSYDLHLLPAHATKRFNFSMTMPSGYSVYKYGVGYENKSYDWNYVPMPIYENEDSHSTGLFKPLLQPDSVDPDLPDNPNPDQPGYQPADGAKAYYVKNIDSGCYLNIVESTNKCAVLSHDKEVLYFEPTGQTGCYVIKGHTGLFMGRYEDANGNSNSWNLSSSLLETWKVEEIETGKYAFRSTSNGDGASAYLGFDDIDKNVSPWKYFSEDAAGFAAFRNKSYAAHGLFALEEVEQEPETPDQPDGPEIAFDGTIHAVGNPVYEQFRIEDFPVEGTGYYLKNLDSGCYLNIVPDKDKSAVLSNTPEQFYFTAVTNPITNEKGYYIYTANDSNHWLGGHLSNTFGTNNSVRQMWYVREVSAGVYAFIDVENNGYDEMSAAASDTKACYLGFMDYYYVNDSYFSKKPAGCYALRNMTLTEGHALFVVETPGSIGGADTAIYGDVDENRTVEAADVKSLVDILLLKKDVTREADTDLNRVITIGDVTKLINYLKK